MTNQPDPFGTPPAPPAPAGQSTAQPIGESTWKDRLAKWIGIPLFVLVFMAVLPSSRDALIRPGRNIYNAVKGRTSLADVSYGECYRVTEDSDYDALDAQDCAGGGDDLYRVRWVFFAPPSRISAGSGCDGGLEIYPHRDGPWKGSGPEPNAAHVCFDAYEVFSTWPRAQTLTSYQVSVGDCVEIPDIDPNSQTNAEFNRIDCSAAGAPNAVSITWVAQFNPVLREDEALVARCDGTPIVADGKTPGDGVSLVFCGAAL